MLFNTGVRLSDEVLLIPGLVEKCADCSKIVALQLGTPALSADSNDLVNSDIQKMPQKLIQSVICIAADLSVSTERM